MDITEMSGEEEMNSLDSCVWSDDKQVYIPIWK